jgi:hypothetical protein
MASRTASLPASLLLVAILSAPAAAQTPLGRPTATFPEDFGSIQTVRELRDGRILVADPLGAALYLVDMDAGKRTVVGSKGQGPQEYLQPDAVWPLPGDSTLLVDLGNARLVTLAPDLKFGATRPIAQGDFEPGRPLVLALPQGVDGTGSVYFRTLGRGLGGEPADSGAILRLPRGGGAAVSVATIKLQDQRTTRSGGADNQNVSMEPLPLTPEDAWGVAPDGSVVIARSGDYHVEWVALDGTVRRGPAVPWESVRVSGADKEEFVADMGRSGGGIAVRLEIQDGRPSMSLQRGGMPGAGRREVDRYTWPDRKPAFHGARIPVDPQGRAWVRRHVRAGDPTTYDVFDRAGRRVGTVTLEAGKRVVGFGARSVYAVSFDDFDLAYLERYALPSL